MRITLSCLGLALLLVCSGCATGSTARHHTYAAEAGGVGNEALGGHFQGVASSGAAADYYEILSDPGPF